MTDQSNDIPEFFSRKPSTLSRLPQININGYKWVWITTCCIIVFLNTMICLIAVRDMILSGYNGQTHYLATAAFTFTIGILAVVDVYVIKRE